MADYQPPSSEEVSQIAADYYRDRSRKTTPQDEPKIVLVGGQPGAGKSVTSALARSELAENGGYIHVDADRMRERIPVGNAKPSSEETQADAGRLVQALRQQATENRRNIVEEGTYRNPEGVEKFTANMREKGYLIEMLAVGTSREESLLGIYQRYELQHEKGTENPRFVPEKYHDEAMEGFERTLAKVQFDRVRIVNRDGETLFDSHAKDGQQKTPVEALRESRTLTDVKLAQVMQGWAMVQKAADERVAPGEYITTVAQHAKRLHEMQNERIHLHAMNKLEQNKSVLKSDPRYASHSGSELLKAAYFRGFHEKACAFKGIPPDFVKYDNTVSNRSTLSTLPDVAGLSGRATTRQERVQSRSDDGHSL